MSYDKIPVGDAFPSVINVVVEIAGGTHNKYEYDEKLHVFKLDRVLHSPLFYPVDYGFVPETRADDGDHTDVLIINDSPVFPGCLMEVRPIGVLKMTDGGEQDDKIIAVPKGNPHYKHVEKLQDIAPHILDEITHFFEAYKKLEKKQVLVQGYGTLDDALEILKANHGAFKEERS